MKNFFINCKALKEGTQKVELVQKSNILSFKFHLLHSDDLSAYMVQQFDPISDLQSDSYFIVLMKSLEIPRVPLKEETKAQKNSFKGGYRKAPYSNHNFHNTSQKNQEGIRNHSNTQEETKDDLENGNKIPHTYYALNNNFLGHF